MSKGISSTLATEYKAIALDVPSANHNNNDNNEQPNEVDPLTVYALQYMSKSWIDKFKFLIKYRCGWSAVLWATSVWNVLLTIVVSAFGIPTWISAITSVVVGSGLGIIVLFVFGKKPAIQTLERLARLQLEKDTRRRYQQLAEEIQKKALDSALEAKTSQECMHTMLEQLFSNASLILPDLMPMTANPSQASSPPLQFPEQLPVVSAPSRPPQPQFQPQSQSQPQPQPQPQQSQPQQSQPDHKEAVGPTPIVDPNLSKPDQPQTKPHTKLPESSNVEFSVGSLAEINDPNGVATVDPIKQMFISTILVSNANLQSSIVQIQEWKKQQQKLIELRNRADRDAAVTIQITDHDDDREDSLLYNNVFAAPR